MSHDERAAVRARKIFMAAYTLRSRVGVVTLEEVSQTALATLSEMKGLWQCLLDLGLINEDERQKYLDRGADALLAQIDAKASQVVVARGN